MADETKQFDQEGPGEFSDETIRRFLLGRLTADDQTAFAERLLGTDILEERVRLAELDLADDYAFARLTPLERERFERVFPVSTTRKQQLRVSRALRESSLLSPAPEGASAAETRTTAREILRRLLGIDRPALGYAVGFAALLLFAGIVWVAVKERRSNQPVIATHQPTPVATREDAHPTASPTVSPQPTVKPSPTPDVSAALSVIATFVLSPGGLRDGGEMAHIAVPQGGAGIVRLQLTLDTGIAGSYTAELLTAEGRTVYASNKKAAPGARVVFDVPGRLLKNGDYQVKLSRIVGGSATSAGRYPFRVTQ